MKPFEDYQLEELKEAREYIDRAWGCKNAHMVHRTVSYNGQGATFFGLTHDTQSVCAVILPFGEPYVRLVHFSAVTPFPSPDTQVDDRDPHNPVEFTESPEGERANTKDEDEET